MAKPAEFTLFMNYAEKVKDFLTKNAYLKKFPKEENVQVFFATPPMAFSKFLIPVINGANLNPTISFYLSGIEYLPNQNLLGYVSKNIRVGPQSFMIAKPHIIYKLSFKISILAGNERDDDILQYQLMTRAPFRKPHAFSILDQWGTLYTENPTLDTDLIPGEAKDRAIARGLDLIIPRAYLPVESEIYDGIIEEINVSYETNRQSI